MAQGEAFSLFAWELPRERTVPVFLISWDHRGSIIEAVPFSKSAWNWAKINVGKGSGCEGSEKKERARFPDLAEHENRGERAELATTLSRKNTLIVD